MMFKPTTIYFRSIVLRKELDANFKIYQIEEFV